MENLKNAKSLFVLGILSLFLLSSCSPQTVHKTEKKEITTSPTYQSK